MDERLGLTLAILGITWAGVYNIVQVIEIANAKRDLILDIDKDGRLLDRDQKTLLLRHDYIPMMFGLCIVAVLYGSGLIAILFTATSTAAIHVVGCIGALLFVGYTLVATIITMLREVRVMKEYIAKSTSSS